MLGPVNWIGLVLVGAALLWSLHLTLVGNRPLLSNPFLRGVQIGGWTLVIMGLVGPILWTSAFGWLVALVLLAVLATTVNRFRYCSARQLMWAMAYSADHELPLSDTARAFAADRTDEVGRRAWYLADRLDAGASLDEAITGARLPATVATRLFARLGHSANAIETLRGSTNDETPMEASTRSQLLPALLYLGLITLTAVVMITFAMIKVVPTYLLVLQDFDLPIPPPLRLLVGVTDAVQWVYLTPLLGLILVGLVALGGYLLLRYLGWIYAEPVGLQWIEWPYHAARVAKALATELEMGNDVSTAFTRIERAYPTPHVANEVHEMREAVGRGMPWQVTLANSRLFSRDIQPLLNSAARLGNAPWALTQVASQIVRRTEYRRRLFVQWATPLAVLAVGLPVAFVAVALLQPLFQLTSSLS